MAPSSSRSLLVPKRALRTAQRSSIKPCRRAGTLGLLASPGQATITNIGVFGGHFSQPILTAGQPIIVGLGSVERRLVPQQRGVGVRALQPVSLAYDRNRLDEVMASRMLRDLLVQLAAGR